jgi:hypothetical protein
MARYQHVYVAAELPSGGERVEEGGLEPAAVVFCDYENGHLVGLLVPVR